MISQDGLNYVKQQLNAGISPQVLKQAMIGAGWQSTDVDSLINSVMQDKARVTSPAPVNTSIQTAKPSKVGVIFLIIFIVFVALAAAYYFIYSPQKVLAKTLVGMKNVKTVNYSSNLVGEIQNFDLLAQINGSNDDSSNLNKLNVVTTGSYDSIVANNTKFSAKTSASVVSSTTGQLEAETRYINNILYFKADKIPDFGLDFTKFLGQWIKADVNSATNVAGDQIKKELTSEQLDKFPSVYERNQFLTASNPKFERLNSDFVYRYDVVLDREILKNFAVDYNKSVLLKPISDTEISDIQTTIGQLPEIKGNLWIGIFDSYLRKLNLNFILNGDLVTAQGTVNLDLTLKDFNKAVTIEAPTDAKSLESIMTDLMSVIMPGTNTKDSDNDGLTDAEESVWKTEINKADTDGDTYLDGNEVCNGFNPAGPGKLTTEQLSLPKPVSCTRIAN